MKKILLVSFFLFFLMFGSFALAHEPADIIFNYNAKNKIFSVGIAHVVKDPQTHFIKQINIKLNVKEFIAQNFLSQTNSDVQAVSYAMVNLKKGDIIEITAICNKGGQLKKTFKIE